MLVVHAFSYRLQTTTAVHISTLYTGPTPILSFKIIKKPVKAGDTIKREEVATYIYIASVLRALTHLQRGD